MSQPITLWIDSANNRLAAGWNSFVFGPKQSFVQGATYDILLRWIKRPTVANSFMEEIPWGTGELSLEIGTRAIRPTGGKFYINFEDSTSELLDYNITRDKLENALNSMQDIVVAGGVSVTQVNDDAFKIVFQANGIQSAISGSGESLVPSSQVLVNQIDAGSANTKAVYWLYLRQKVVVNQVFVASEATCTAAVAAMTQNIWDIYLTSEPQDGTFSFFIDDGEVVTASVFATVSEVSALVGAGFKVTKQGDYRWRLTKVDGSAFQVDVDNYNIVSFNGRVARVTIDNDKASETLAGLAETTTTLEIAITDGEYRNVILSVPCSLVGKLTQ